MTKFKLNTIPTNKGHIALIEWEIIIPTLRKFNLESFFILSINLTVYYIFNPDNPIPNIKKATIEKIKEK